MNWGDFDATVATMWVRFNHIYVSFLLVILTLTSSFFIISFLYYYYYVSLFSISFDFFQFSSSNYSIWFGFRFYCFFFLVFSLLFIVMFSLFYVLKQQQQKSWITFSQDSINYIFFLLLFLRETPWNLQWSDQIVSI